LAGGEQEALRRRLRLLVAYLGTPFHGFALQPGVPTVAGVLSEAIGQVLRYPVELTCAGRTDAGVHAWGQVVSLDVAIGADLERLQRSLNKMLGPTVVVRDAAWAPEGFDARRSALSRTYRYRISCSRWPDPFRAATTWHVGHPLDLRSMQAASDPLLGEHDFASFCHAAKIRAAKMGAAKMGAAKMGAAKVKAPENSPPSLVRRVLAAEWSDLGGEQLLFEIRAASFCQQMVRSVVGALVEVGAGRKKAGEMMGIMAAKDRSVAGSVAPPHGLCLWEVEYPHD
jgi:tRNA pseudouridine38-40 synthase